MLFLIISAQVHLFACLFDPNVCFPPAAALVLGDTSVLAGSRLLTATTGDSFLSVDARKVVDICQALFFARNGLLVALPLL